MSTQDNKNSIKKFLSLAGVAGASVFLSVPVLAQTNPNYNTRANSTVRAPELLAQAISDFQESPRNCGGYQGNATTGGGYNCALNRINGPSSNGQASTMDRQSPASRSDTMSQPSTTGAGYPGNGVAPNSGANTMDRQSPNVSSDTMEEPSNTGAGYPGNGLVPSDGYNTPVQPFRNNDRPPTVNQGENNDNSSTGSQDFNYDQGSRTNQSPTGAGYPGNGVAPNSGTSTMQQRSTASDTTIDSQSTPQSSPMYQPSTTGAGYPGNGVSPNSGANTMDRQSPSGGTNSGNAQPTNQGVQGLW
jgi:hypothetical protein